MSSSPRSFLILLTATLALPIAIAYGFGGSEATSTGATTSMARSGELAISDQLIAIYAAQRMPQGRVPSEEQLTVLRDELANMMAVAALAEDRGYAEHGELRDMMMLDRVRTLASGYMQDEIGGRPITDEELHARYDETLAAGTIEIRASHILVADEVTAQELIQQLDAGADFAELASTSSTGPSGPNGGDLGWFAPDAMVEPFAQAAMALADDTYTSAPVQTRFGWHVILRTGSRDVPPPSFDEVADQLRQEIERARFDVLIEEARAAYPVSGA